MRQGKLTVMTLRVSYTGSFHSLWIIDLLRARSLTIEPSRRRFNQLTCGQFGPHLLSRQSSA
ncbi:protein of unknown function [Agreia sp. COWG]|nr:protein of unknown function [Agreia sp. COWG]